MKKHEGTNQLLQGSRGVLHTVLCSMDTYVYSIRIAIRILSHPDLQAVLYTDVVVALGLHSPSIEKRHCYVDTGNLPSRQGS